jgi:hypothetical protein
MLASAMITLLRVELVEPTAGNWTDAQLLKYLNLAASKYATDTGVLMAPPVHTDITSGYAGVTAPSDCPGPHAVLAIYCQTDELDMTFSAAIIRADGNPHIDAGTPTKWYPLSSGGAFAFGLYPIPNATIVNGLTLWYWKDATVMTTTPDSTCDIPDNFIMGVIHGAAELAFLARRDSTMANSHRNLYDDMVARANAWVGAVIAANLRDTNADRSLEHRIF